MSDHDVFETSEDGRYRVRIVRDNDFPSEPYNDGGSPILRLHPSSWSGEWDAEQITSITSHVIDSAIEKAAAHFGREPDRFERYMRIFHGTTDVKWWDSRGNGGGDYVYVTFDTADWRTEVGLTDEWIAQHADHFTKNGIANMDEWRSYVEGDTYGIVVEELVTWHADAMRGRLDLPITKTVWEHVDSVWGFYGLSEYVKNEAKQMLWYAQSNAEEN